MFVFTPFVILAFTAVGRVASETYKKAGDKAVLSPGSVSGPITSITWKHGPDIAVEWYRQEKTEYRDFKGRCEVNTTTGALTITNLSVKDSGSYTAEINHKIMKTTEIKVITAVPKPTINKQCNSEVTQCTLTCNASITADMGTVTYSWKTGDSQIQAESSSNQLNITKDNTEFVGKLISCQLENPVSSERSKDIMSPFTNESSASVSTAAVIVFIVFIVLVALIALGLLVDYLIWRNCRTEGENAGFRQYVAWFKTRRCHNCGWGQCCACFNTKNFLNPAERSRGTERSANGTVTGVEYRPVSTEDRQEPVSTGTNNEAAAIPENQEDPNQHQPEPEPTDTNNGAEMPNSTSERQNETRSDQTPAESTDPISEAATSSESQTVKNQDQPEPEPRGTTTEAAAIAENQEDPNQHQPEPEPTDTTTEAEMPKNTSEHQTEVGPDQTPAESTDPSSEAETSAEAPNAEEPPDHHHQQEDETTEE